MSRPHPFNRTRSRARGDPVVPLVSTDDRTEPAARPAPSIPHLALKIPAARGPDAAASRPPAPSPQVDAVTAYQRAWCALPDEAAIRYWVEKCWTPDAWYLNPFCDPIHGVDALTRLILDYPSLFPDARIRPSGSLVIHAHHAQWRWMLSSSTPIRILGANLGRIITGHDLVNFTPDHRIRVAVAAIDGLCSCGAANPTT